MGGTDRPLKIWIGSILAGLGLVLLAVLRSRSLP
jgi:hypothetical protein